jgi:murein DD-endopeptidase MepM/ murein hydrolase activator NlpD
MDGPSVDPLGNPWYLITDGETTGWVFGDYLVGADQPPAPDGDEAPVAEPEPEPVDTAGVATGSFMYPVERYTFTQGFGCSPYWFEPWVASVGCNYHNGIDLANDAYTPIMAADGGTVDQVGWCDCGLGYYVRVDHGNGFRTLYGHMAEYPWASVGQQVAKGDVVGPMGSSGNSTGPHLHFIVNYQGVDQDPLWYLT